LSISKKDLADLAFIVLCSNIKEKLKHFKFLSVNQLLQKASAVESRSTLGEP
jgi:hypothetical protein